MATVALKPVLRTTLYLWKCTFIGFVLGLGTAWLLSLNTWLNMRMVTGSVIPWFVLVALLLGVYPALRRGRPPERWVVSSRQLGLFTLLVLVAVPIGAARGNWDAIAVVPAVLVREALHVYAPAASLNLGLMMVLALALGIPSLFFEHGGAS